MEKITIRIILAKDYNEILAVVNMHIFKFILGFEYDSKKSLF